MSYCWVKGREGHGCPQSRDFVSQLFVLPDPLHTEKDVWYDILYLYTYMNICKHVKIYKYLYIMENSNLAASPSWGMSWCKAKAYLEMLTCANPFLALAIVIAVQVWVMLARKSSFSPWVDGCETPRCLDFCCWPAWSNFRSSGGTQVWSRVILRTAPRFVKYNLMRLMHKHDEFLGKVLGAISCPRFLIELNPSTESVFDWYLLSINGRSIGIDKNDVLCLFSVP